MDIAHVVLGPGTGPLPEEERIHEASEGPDSVVGIFCTYCYVSWPCLAERMRQGRVDVARAVEAEYRRQCESEGPVDWLKVARTAVRANAEISRHADSSGATPRRYQNRWFHDGDVDL